MSDPATYLMAEPGSWVEEVAHPGAAEESAHETALRENVAAEPKPKSKADALYDKLVAELIAAMEQGEMPWQRPWFCQLPANLYSKREYQCLNSFVLESQRKCCGYKTSWWITAKQAAKLGGAIRADQLDKSSFVFCVRRCTYLTRDGSGRHIHVPHLMVRIHDVFNFDQTEGLEKHRPPGPSVDFHPIEEAEQIVRGYTDPPVMRENDTRAYYRPHADIVGMPSRHDFISVEEFYATLFHELVHSTGHEKRTQRLLKGKWRRDCVEAYAREELVAELGASFLCAKAGFQSRTAKNSAAYVQSWLKALRHDKRFLFWAAGNAQKASDWILGKRPTGDGTGATEVDSMVLDPGWGSGIYPQELKLVPDSKPAKVVRRRI